MLVTIFVIGAMHLVGFELSLYWRLPFYDIIVHTLAGFLVALFAISLAFRNFATTPKRIFIAGIISMLVIGICWEVFELASGVVDTAENGYISDTIIDLISDTIGGFMAVYYFLLKLKNK